jgi:hypothetical protein
MAVTDMTACDQNSISAFKESIEHMQRVYSS